MCSGKHSDKHGMKERIIDIPKQATRTPSRGELARVGAVMLFPDDESSRDRYEESAAAFMACEWQICEAQQLPEIVQWAMRCFGNTVPARDFGGICAL
jgi:hypothetical protein